MTTTSYCCMAEEVDENQHAAVAVAALLVVTVAATRRRPNVREDRDNIATICPELENIMVLVGRQFDSGNENNGKRSVVCGFCLWLRR